MTLSFTFPRIVILSSAAHESGSVQWDDLNCESRYHPLRAYSQSKLANVLHGKELAARLVKDNVSVYSLHPGDGNCFSLLYVTCH